MSELYCSTSITTTQCVTKMQVEKQTEHSYIYFPNFTMDIRAHKQEMTVILRLPSIMGKKNVTCKFSMIAS
jgi:hypothetical protein